MREAAKWLFITSAAICGVLGFAWATGIRSVSIDTRFPRYATCKEGYVPVKMHRWSHEMTKPFYACVQGYVPERVE